MLSMARREMSVASGALSTPKPPEKILLHTVTIKPGVVLHRVHKAEYAGTAFNPSLRGSARFSPLLDDNGDVIPTLYAAYTFDGAAMETVFHDVPFAPGPKSFPRSRLLKRQCSRIEVTQRLVLADLTSKSLRAMGIKRNELIDTEADQYPATREWARAIHAQHPDVQGLFWVSRQDDTDRALILFGDRVAPEAIRQVEEPLDLTDRRLFPSVLMLADRIGVNVVP